MAKNNIINNIFMILDAPDSLDRVQLNIKEQAQQASSIKPNLNKLYNNFCLLLIIEHFAQKSAHE